MLVRFQLSTYQPINLSTFSSLHQPRRNNPHIQQGPVFICAFAGSRYSNFINDLYTAYHLAKHGVVTIQLWRAADGLVIVSPFGRNLSSEQS